MTGRALRVAGAASLLVTMASEAFAAGNLVVNGDFSAGYTGFTTDYTISTQTPYLFQNEVTGLYAVIPIGNVAGEAQYGDWTNVRTDPSGGNGNVFAAEGGPNANMTVWAETIPVAKNTIYMFSFNAAEISNPCCSNAVFVPAINGVNYPGDLTTGAWKRFSVTWNSGSNTSATLSLTDANTDVIYNDFVLDDISLTAAGSGVGDPHFTTFDGVHYNFQGGGDFLLARSTAPADDFEVQIETSPSARNKTVISEAAATLCGHNVRFAAAGAGSGGSFAWIDGLPSSLSSAHPVLPLGDCTIDALSRNEYEATWNTGEVLNVTDDGDFLDVSSWTASDAAPGSLQGLLTSELDSNRWRVSGADSLFDVPEPGSLALFGFSLVAFGLIRRARPGATPSLG